MKQVKFWDWESAAVPIVLVLIFAMLARGIVKHEWQWWMLVLILVLLVVSYVLRKAGKTG